VTTPLATGPAQAPVGATVGTLDMTDERDRGLVRRQFTAPQGKHRRWPGIDDDTKGQFVSALRVALRWALERQDHRGVNGCVKTLAMLEGQNQSDEHLEEKYGRVDDGLATDSVAHTVYTCEPPRVIGEGT
jgi:hypothetical protein